MEKHDPNLLPAANGRTFVQILQEEYNGNLSALCVACGLAEKNRKALDSFLNRRRSATFCRTILREISSAFGEEIEVLFPSELYRQPIFSSVQESPGYRLLAKRFQLQFDDRKGKSLLALMKEQGFTRSDDHIFRQALVGSITPTYIPILLQRICEKFNVSQKALFPSAIYEQYVPSRASRKHHTLLLDDSAEAQTIMQKAAHLPESELLERQEAMQIFLAKVLQRLTLVQRKVFEAHFLAGKKRTLAKTAEALEYADYRNVDEIFRQTRERIFKVFPELIEEWKSLQTIHDNNDRIFF